MKIGCCVNMAAADEAGIGIDHIETLAKLGYDYVELPIAQMMTLDDTRFNELVKRVENSGIKCEAGNNFLKADLRITGSATTKPDVLRDYLLQALERASELGINSIVFGSSGAKNVPDGFDHKIAWAQIVEFLHVVDELIDNRDIYIAIEPLNRQESNIIQLASEGLELAKEVNKPHIRLLIDYYHLSAENEDLTIINEASGYLQHMHIANPVGRTWPKCDDSANYAAFFEMLKRAEYNKRVSIEAFTEDFEADAERSLKFLRTIIH